MARKNDIAIPIDARTKGRFRSEVPLGYLHMNTQIVLKNTETGERIHAIAGMDGHEVSAHFGMRQGNEHYTPDDKAYINVWLDSVNREFYEGYGSHDNPHWPNDGFNVRDGWVALVSDDDYVVYQNDLKVNQKLRNADREAALEEMRTGDLVRKLNDAKKLVADVEAALAKPRKEV